MKTLRSTLLAAHCSLLATFSFAATPSTWESRGVGGGGALFSPSFSPHNANELYISCDMSEVFRTTSLGASWQTVPHTELQGNRASRVSFTSDPNILYTVDFTLDDLVDAARPTKSTDGGATWTRTADPTGGETYSLFADPTGTDRIVASSYGALYVSTNGGTSWNQRWTAADNGVGLHVAGAFFDGTNIWVGTNEGLLHSSNNGTSFALASAGGLPAGTGIYSFCGAKEGATIRFWAVVAEDLYAGIFTEEMFWPHQDVYRLNWGDANWAEADAGLPAGPADDGNSIVYVACARNDIDTVWASGQADTELPLVYRSTNGGTNWTQVLLPVNNQNAATGWSGHGGDRGWWYGAGSLGLGVAPLDANRAAYTDLGFCHVTTDGGANWRQAYVDQSDENPAGSPTPTRKHYNSVGLEDTTNWRLTWLDENTMWASFSDIRGIRSIDGGEAWGFDYSGHTDNTSYDCVRHPGTGVSYLATGTRHDMYQTTTLTDSSINGADGTILFSTNLGSSWSLLHDFDDTVYDLELSPSSPNRMYAAVINSTNGGIFVTNNLSAGASSTWTKLTNPPRTEGHPYSIQVLESNAGVDTLVSTYCGRRTSSFTQSSGVFYSTDGGASWSDRSHANMTYYVKDLVVDPHDATKNTWYVCVWNGYGGPLNTNNLAGGLYRTTDRGLNWTRIWDSHRVSSMTINPANAQEAYVTTEAEGLWHTDDLGSANPAMQQLVAYPFRQPERVYWDPFNANRIWVTSFGNGIRVGTLPGGPSGVDGWSFF